MADLFMSLLGALRSTFRTRAELTLENLALRQQLANLRRTSARPRLRRTPVQNDVSPEVKALIRQMAEANVTWGAPRIHGELLKLGIDISERSVSRFLPPKLRKPPSQTWRTFIDNHLGSMASIDFLTVPTATFHVLYVFLVLSHDRRRVVHWNVTSHPGAQWTAQQIVEAFPEDTAPKYMLRDRDGIYGEKFQSRVDGMGIEQVLTAPRSPWQNPYAERIVGMSVENVLITSLSSARSTCTGF